MPPLLISDIIFQELSADSPALQSFTCEEAELCDFLVDDALSDAENCYSKTHLLLHNGTVIGYFSLVSDTVTLSRGVKSKFGIRYRYGDNIPALKIARLARSDLYKGCGIGDIIMQRILQLAYEQSKISGFRVLTVDAKDTQMALEYYLRYGFRRGNKKRDTIPMYLDFLPIRDYFRSENV